jgi:hypothetical protein
MSGKALPPTTVFVSPSNGMDQPHKNKCLKHREGPINLNPGEGMKLNEISTMQQNTLVGRFASKCPKEDSLKTWTMMTFGNLLGYEAISLVLTKGWLAWIFRLESDSNKILAGRWCYGTQVLFMK